MSEKFHLWPGITMKSCYIWTKSKNREGCGRISLYVTATSVNGTKYSSYLPVNRMAIFLHLNAQPIDTEHHASHICVSVPRFSPHHISLET